MKTGSKSGAVLRLLRTVPVAGWSVAIPAFALGCTALASLTDGIADWSGPFRIWITVYRQILTDPLAASHTTRTVWDCVYLSVLFGGLVFGACLRAELRTHRFVISQNITRVAGGAGWDPDVALRRRIVLFGLAAVAYVTGQAATAYLSLLGASASSWFLLYLPVTYILVAPVLIRQTRKRDILGLPLISRVETAGILCAPWITVAAVAALAFANALAEG